MLDFEFLVLKLLDLFKVTLDLLQSYNEWTIDLSKKLSQYICQKVCPKNQETFVKMAKKRQFSLCLLVKPC